MQISNKKVHACDAAALVHKMAYMPQQQWDLFWKFHMYHYCL